MRQIGLQSSPNLLVWAAGKNGAKELFPCARTRFTDAFSLTPQQV